MKKILKNKKIMIPSLCGIVAIITLAIILICTLPGKGTATKMSLSGYSGEVVVENAKKKEISIVNGLKLFDKYQVKTGSDSYAYVILDENKLVLLNENSLLEINKAGKKLKLNLLNGELYFNVSKPLKNDETFEIQTQTMITGIRGTDGFVIGGEQSSVELITGTVSLFDINAVEVGTLASTNIGVFTSGTLQVSKIQDSDITPFMGNSLVLFSNVFNQNTEEEIMKNFGFNLFETSLNQALVFDDNYAGEVKETYQYAIVSRTDAQLIINKKVVKGTETITDENLTYTIVSAKSATCSEKGNKKYYKDNAGNLYSNVDVVENDLVMESTTIESVTIPKLEHVYNYVITSETTCDKVCSVGGEKTELNFAFVVDQTDTKLSVCSNTGIKKYTFGANDEVNVETINSAFTTCDIVSVENLSLDSSYIIPENKAIFVRTTVSLSNNLTVNGCLCVSYVSEQIDDNVFNAPTTINGYFINDSKLLKVNDSLSINGKFYANTNEDATDCEMVFMEKVIIGDNGIADFGNATINFGYLVIDDEVIYGEIINNGLLYLGNSEKTPDDTSFIYSNLIKETFITNNGTMRVDYACDDAICCSSELTEYNNVPFFKLNNGSKTYFNDLLGFNNIYCPYELYGTASLKYISSGNDVNLNNVVIGLESMDSTVKYLINNSYNTINDALKALEDMADTEQYYDFVVEGTYVSLILMNDVVEKANIDITETLINKFNGMLEIDINLNGHKLDLGSYSFISSTGEGNANAIFNINSITTKYKNDVFEKTEIISTSTVFNTSGNTQINLNNTYVTSTGENGSTVCTDSMLNIVCNESHIICKTTTETYYALVINENGDFVNKSRSISLLAKDTGHISNLGEDTTLLQEAGNVEYNSETYCQFIQGELQ